MHFHPFSRRLSQLAGVLVLLGAGLCLPGLAQTPAAAPAASPAPAKSLDNATCLSCHDGKKGKLEAPGADGGKRPLEPVNPGKYQNSVHG